MIGSLKTNSRSIRIAVFGHVGQENLGDEAAFKAVIDAARSRRPDADIIGISVNPEETVQRYGIRTFPIWRDTLSIGRTSGESKNVHEQDSAQPVSPAEGAGRLKGLLRRVPGLFPLLRSVVHVFALVPVVMRESLFLWQTYRMLKQVNLLAVAGSQHLNDYVLGPWNFPYTTFKWTFLAKLAGAKVVLLNVGAGPLQTSLGKWFVKQTVIRSDFQSYRDDSSVRCIEELGVPVSKPSLPDMVFSLNFERSRKASVQMPPKIIIGVNPIPFNSADYWIGANQENYGRYIRVMAHLVQWILEQGHAVTLFPTQLTLDPKVIRDIRALLPASVSHSKDITEASIKTVEDLAATIDTMDIVVASRFHGVIFSMLLEKPVLGIAYADKTRDLMTYMGLSEYTVDISKLDLETLQEIFQTIESRRDAIRRILRDRLQEAKGTVEAQFDTVFAMLGEMDSPKVTKRSVV